MHRPLDWLWQALAALVAAFPTVAVGADLTPQAKFFESEVRPLLVEHCQSCHGPQKQKGGLRLDNREAVLKGGKSGPAINPAEPKKSKLALAVSYKDEDLQMPPEEKLGEKEVAILTKWAELGAPWTDGAAMVSTGTSRRRPIKDEDRAFWSFQPPQAVAPPSTDDRGWCRNEIDRFVFEKLKQQGLEPAPPADRATLARRAYFDLWGLPPSPEELDRFVNDTAPDAWERLIDQLLDSPRYGERWARHWLDIARYAESDGHRQDAYRLHVWPYRDYVIRCFNQDKPYDRFVLEQLAGDEVDPENPDVLIATAFLRHGPYEYNQRDVRRQWSDILNEATDVVGDAFLGMSVSCARCHDHKFDPILQADYYRLQSFLAGLLPRQDLLLATAEEKAQHDQKQRQWEEKTADIRQGMAKLQAPFVHKAAALAISRFPADIQAMINKPADQRSPLEEQLAQLALRQVTEAMTGAEAKVTGEGKAKHAELGRQLAQLDDWRPKPLRPAFVATDVGPVAPPTMIPGGDSQRPPIAPGYLAVLDRQPLQIPTTRPSASSSGRRTALAMWLTQPNHPLTTRVIVNRIWQYHFGRGLVATTSDFGKLGDRPSHPPLLDWLARRFVADGWSFKKMHRLLMMSAAYQQSSRRAMPQAARMGDPENRLLWKYNARRLDAEQIRDAILAVSGELRLDMYGSAVIGDVPRRSIYVRVVRNNRDPLLDVFDFPDSFSSAASRNNTTTSTQALMMMNGKWMIERAAAMAKRLRASDSSVEKQVASAWRLAYGRLPSVAEREMASEFLAKSPLDDLCHVLMNSSQFLYVE